MVKLLENSVFVLQRNSTTTTATALPTHYQLGLNLKEFYVSFLLIGISSLISVPMNLSLINYVHQRISWKSKRHGATEQTAVSYRQTRRRGYKTEKRKRSSQEKLDDKDAEKIMSFFFAPLLP